MGSLDYLVGFGVGGDFGRFRSATPLSLGRGEAVVVRTERGIELGQVLRPARERHARWMPNTGVGPLLRVADDVDLATHDRLAERATELLERASAVVDQLSLPVAILDAEFLLDSASAVLHLVRWQPCEIRDLIRPLSSEFEATIHVVELGVPAEPAEDHGCGSCGEGGGCGSCGSGGCGSCDSAQPEEVSAHFAELRERMERRVSLL